MHFKDFLAASDRLNETLSFEDPAEESKVVTFIEAQEHSYTQMQSRIKHAIDKHTQGNLYMLKPLPEAASQDRNARMLHDAVVFWLCQTAVLVLADKPPPPVLLMALIVVVFKRKLVQR
jgi:hypothetical protein